MRTLTLAAAALLVGCLSADIPPLVDPDTPDRGGVDRGAPDAQPWSDGGARQDAAPPLDQGADDAAPAGDAAPPVDQDMPPDAGEADGGARACEPGEVEACGVAVGACEPGVRTCGVGGVFGDCSGGTQPQPETCNGQDDDCDGAADEGASPDTPCAVGQGVCQRDGLTRCTDGQPVCDAQAGAAGAEACDGMLDEDCDGAVDEGCACRDGQQAPCGLAMGICVAGTQTCEAGAWGACEGAGTPEPEVCDGLDNDCDGAPDEAEAADQCEIPGAVAQCEEGACALQRCARNRYNLDEADQNGCERGVAVAAPAALGVATDGPWVDGGPLRVLTAWVDDQQQLKARLNQQEWVIEGPEPAHPVALLVGGTAYVGALVDDGGGALARVVVPPADLQYEHPALGKPGLGRVDDALVVAHLTPDARLLVQRLGGEVALSDPGETFDPQVRPAVLDVDGTLLVVARRADGEPRLVLYTVVGGALLPTNRTLTGPWTGVHLARLPGRDLVALSAVQDGQARRQVGPLAGLVGGGFIEGGGSSFGDRPYMTPSSFVGPGQLLWVSEYVRASNPAILLLQASNAGGPVDGVPYPNMVFQRADELRFASGGADFAWAAFRIGNQASLARIELE